MCPQSTAGGTCCTNIEQSKNKVCMRMSKETPYHKLCVVLCPILLAAASERKQASHLLKVQAKMLVVDAVILDGVIDVRDLRDVKCVILF